MLTIYFANVRWKNPLLCVVVIPLNVYLTFSDYYDAIRIIIRIPCLWIPSAPWKTQHLFLNETWSLLYGVGRQSRTVLKNMTYSSNQRINIVAGQLK